MQISFIASCEFIRDTEGAERRGQKGAMYVEERVVYANLSAPRRRNLVALPLDVLYGVYGDVFLPESNPNGVKVADEQLRSPVIMRRCHEMETGEDGKVLTKLPMVCTNSWPINEPLTYKFMVDGEIQSL